MLIPIPICALFCIVIITLCFVIHILFTQLTDKAKDDISFIKEIILKLKERGYIKENVKQPTIETEIVNSLLFN